MRTVPLKSTYCRSQHKSHRFYVTPLASKSARAGLFLQEATALLNFQQSQKKKGYSPLRTTAANLIENGACVPNAQPVLNKAERNDLSWGSPGRQLVSPRGPSCH